MTTKRRTLADKRKAVIDAAVDVVGFQGERCERCGLCSICVLRNALNLFLPFNDPRREHTK